MRSISARIPGEVVNKIEWLKLFMYNKHGIRFTTTNILISAVNYLYDDMQKEIDKKTQAK